MPIVRLRPQNSDAAPIQGGIRVSVVIPEVTEVDLLCT